MSNYNYILKLLNRLMEHYIWRMLFAVI